MVKIELHGKLKDLYQESVEVSVKSVAEVMRCLKANFSEFNENFVQVSQEYHVVVDNEYYDYENLTQPLGGNSTVKLIPVIAGSKGKGMMILTAVALIAVGATAVYLAGAASAVAAGGTAAAAVGTTTTSIVTSLGLTAWSTTALSALSFVGWLSVGIGAAMLASAFAPKPKAQSNDSVDNQPSHAFNGPVNTLSQGAAIPVGYGELMVGSGVIYAAMSPQEIPV